MVGENILHAAGADPVRPLHPLWTGKEAGLIGGECTKVMAPLRKRDAETPENCTHISPQSRTHRQVYLSDVHGPVNVVACVATRKSC